jgi:hypothetical protein
MLSVIMIPQIYCTHREAHVYIMAVFEYHKADTKRVPTRFNSRLLFKRMSNTRQCGRNGSADLIEIALGRSTSWRTFGSTGWGKKSWGLYSIIPAKSLLSSRIVSNLSSFCQVAASRCGLPLTTVQSPTVQSAPSPRKALCNAHRGPDGPDGSTVYCSLPPCIRSPCITLVSVGRSLCHWPGSQPAMYQVKSSTCLGIQY